MKGRTVHVHVGELVLHGFSAADRFAIGDALQAAMADALAPHLPALIAGRSDVVDGGTVRLASARPAHVGREVAAQVARAVGGKR